MSRRAVRERIFRILFRIDFYDDEGFEEQLELSMNEQDDLKEEDRLYIEKKCRDIAAKKARLDERINEKAKGWKTSRMGKADLTIMRLAVYEINYEEEIPTGVAINEAVELAKKYGNDTSPAFVNGVLARLV
ncbi:MAG: transcription antitermination factor NusB [Lachnospiraceae bacterium]|nr:transcription antitermination factor NusB [Lachnospiraceae bacterium]